MPKTSKSSCRASYDECWSAGDEKGTDVQIATEENEEGWSDTEYGIVYHQLPPAETDIPLMFGQPFTPGMRGDQPRGSILIAVGCGMVVGSVTDDRKESKR